MRSPYRSRLIPSWTTVEVPTSASYTITFPSYGTHFAVELQLLGDTVVTETALSLKLNGDTTTGNYHWQRVGGNNGAATVGEGTTFDNMLMAAASAVSGFYSSHFLLFPNFRDARQKTVIITQNGELAALNQRILLNAFKRQTAGVGALTDPITSAQLVPAAGNLAGTVRYAVLYR